MSSYKFIFEGRKSSNIKPYKRFTFSEKYDESLEFLSENKDAYTKLRLDGLLPGPAMYALLKLTCSFDNAVQQIYQDVKIPIEVVVTLESNVVGTNPDYCTPQYISKEFEEIIKRLKGKKSVYLRLTEHCHDYQTCIKKVIDKYLDSDVAPTQNVFVEAGKPCSYGSIIRTSIPADGIFKKPASRSDRILESVINPRPSFDDKYNGPSNNESRAPSECESVAPSEDERPSFGVPGNHMGNNNTFSFGTTTDQTPSVCIFGRK